MPETPPGSDNTGQQDHITNSAARLYRRMTELVVPLEDKSRCYVMVPEDLTPEEGRRLLEVLSAWVPEEEDVD